MTDPESTAPRRQRTAKPTSLGDRAAVWTCIALFGGFFGAVVWLTNWSAL